MSSFLKTVLITGSSRGIGLGLVKSYLCRADVQVVATCRSPETASQLTSLKQEHADRLFVLPLDINSSESFATLQKSLDSVGISSIDILIGMFAYCSLVINN